MENQLKPCEHRGWGQLVSLSPTKKDSYLLLFEISSFDIPRPRHLPGYTSNQNKTALSKKLPFLRALPFHLPYFFLPLSMNFPCSSVGKESACNAGDPSLIPGSGGKWQPTPVFLSREFHGQRSMMGYIQGHKSWTRLSD